MVRPFTKPDDVHGMIASKGVLTSEGGATSHAAVVARQFGIPCVVGASAIKIDLEKRQMTVAASCRQGRRMDFSGRHDRQGLHRQDPDTSPSLEEQTELLTLLTWADEIAPARICAKLPPRVSHPRSAGVGKCRLSEGCTARPLLWRRGHRSLPHRAHVLRTRAPADRAAHDPLGPARNAPSAQRAAPLPAQGLRWSLRGDGWLPGHHPPDRPAAA